MILQLLCRRIVDITIDTGLVVVLNGVTVSATVAAGVVCADIHALYTTAGLALAAVLRSRRFSLYQVFDQAIVDAFACLDSTVRPILHLSTTL